MSAIQAVTVRAGVATAETIGRDLKSMQQLVGGYVEHVRLRGRFTGLHMWVNEQGLLEQLPVRPQPFYPGPIAGDYFITRLDAEGEAAPLTPADVAHVMSELEGCL